RSSSSSNDRCQYLAIHHHPPNRMPIMPDERSQLDQQFSAMDQVGVEWLWSVDWLAKQHGNVPANFIIEGCIELGFTPRRVMDGIAYFDGQQYARLQKWLLAKAQAIAQKYEQSDE